MNRLTKQYLRASVVPMALLFTLHGCFEGRGRTGHAGAAEPARQAPMQPAAAQAVDAPAGSAAAVGHGAATRAMDASAEAAALELAPGSGARLSAMA